MSYRIDVTVWHSRERAREATLEGWVWRGHTKLEILDPSHVLRGATLEPHLGQITFRNLSRGGHAILRGRNRRRIREHQEAVQKFAPLVVEEPVSTIVEDSAPNQEVAPEEDKKVDSAIDEN
ncbi:hypothetical protein RIF29_14454 [Crotalaria pallida]|uniref:Uncharacterized protein n=1 Tax=Crotalaria pallida TaxID=3830 RepID=A0AAN9FH35_CROPI